MRQGPSHYLVGKTLGKRLGIILSISAGTGATLLQVARNCKETAGKKASADPAYSEKHVVGNENYKERPQM